MLIKQGFAALQNYEDYAVRMGKKDFLEKFCKTVDTGHRLYVKNRNPMPRKKKTQPCPICGRLPIVKEHNTPQISKKPFFIAYCDQSEHCGSHEIATNAGDTVDQALAWWNSAIKKWAKKREKEIAEREQMEAVGQKYPTLVLADFKKGVKTYRYEE